MRTTVIRRDRGGTDWARRRVCQTPRFSVTFTWNGVENQVSAVDVCDWGSTDGKGRRTSGREQGVWSGLKRRMSGWPGTCKNEHPIEVVRRKADHAHFNGFTILLRDIGSLALPALVSSSELMGGWIIGSLRLDRVGGKRCHTFER